MSATTDWIIAGASIAAATGTVGTLYASVVTLRRQADDDRRRQASRVNVQLVEGSPLPRIQVHNSSDGTIYDVTGSIRYEGMEAITTDQPEQIRSDKTELLGLDQAGGMLGLVALGDRAATIEVVFTDEADHRWQRDSRGRLRELRWRRSGRIGPWWTRRLPGFARRALVRIDVIKMPPTPGATQVTADDA